MYPEGHNPVVKTYTYDVYSELSIWDVLCCCSKYVPCIPWCSTARLERKEIYILDDVGRKYQKAGSKGELLRLISSPSEKNGCSPLLYSHESGGESSRSAVYIKEESSLGFGQIIPIKPSGFCDRIVEIGDKEYIWELTGPCKYEFFEKDVTNGLETILAVATFHSEDGEPNNLDEFELKIYSLVDQLHLAPTLILATFLVTWVLYKKYCIEISCNALSFMRTFPRASVKVMQEQQEPHVLKPVTREFAV